MTSPAPSVLAQITDTHVTLPGELVYGRYDTAAHLRAAVARLNALQPQPGLVLVTGDLVHHGVPAEYDHFLEIMGELALPWQAIPGNHDVREAFLDAVGDRLPDSRLGAFGQFWLDVGALRLVALDSLHDGHHNGLLCAERLAWLEATLTAAGDRPVVIALHHPPFATGIEWIDLTGGGWTADFERIVARHGTVQSVLAGHIHRPILRRWGGTVAVVSPSTTYQVAADLTDLEAHFTAEPPAIHLCLWTGDACVSHFLPVAAPGEPFEVIDRETLARLKAFAGQNDGLVPKNTSNALRNLTPPD